MLTVNEIFHSIQGESTYAGAACVFVRVTACDLGCSWCDTPYAFTEGMLDAGRFLSLATHHAVIQDDPVGALQALLAAYRMVRHAAQDPFLINQSSRISCQRAATQSLAYTLAVRQGGMDRVGHES